MDTNQIQSKNHQFTKQDIIFSQNQYINSAHILLKGNINIFISPFEENGKDKNEDLIKNSFKIFNLDKNETILGAGDLFLSDKYLFTYRAADNSTVCSYSLQNYEELKTFITSNRKISVQIMDSIPTMLYFSYLALEKLGNQLEGLGTLSDNLGIYFWLLKEKTGFSHTPSGTFFKSSFEKYKILKVKNFFSTNIINTAFIEKDYFFTPDSKYIFTDNLNMPKIEYYNHLYNLPPELRSSFFSADPFITNYQCEDAAKVLLEIQSEICTCFKMISKLVKILFSENEECIFSEYRKAALEIKKANSNIPFVSQAFGYIANKIKNIISIFKNEYENSFQIDLNSIYNACTGILQTKNPVEKESAASGPDSTSDIPDELKNSAAKILEYSNISKDRANSFLANLEAFRNLKEKHSMEGEAVNIKNTINSLFFDIYESVFKRAYAEKNNSRLINMFLTFAYMDEKLLSTEHILNLYQLADIFTSLDHSSIYSMRNWLTKIYTMQKDPSINEFGQDYFEVFREMKKHGQVTDKDKPQYDNDVNKRLNHEIFNMFKINQKVCFGQISSYFPVLHNDMIIARDLSKVAVTYDIIKSGLDKILEIDFSAFHRELSYINSEKGIEKELITKSFIPDFILMPIFGSRGVMWQEIAGRNRGTPGRFIIPIFTNENPDDILLKLTGNFRWELCRTMMGISWNDITLKSLTSEYTDYIQFYKKNTDLSEEAREKIKVQIQKYRNMLRDIFTADYETWVNYESKGVMRLNKIARAILYRYCPFSRSIREQLEKQPAFSDISVQFKNIRAKHTRELESHYKRLVKPGENLEPDLEENLKFYKEM